MSELVFSLKEATQPTMAEVSPGRWVPLRPGVEVPSVTLARWIENPDHSYKLLPFTERLIRVDRHLQNKLGLGDRWDTLSRLITAGFVEGLRICPKTTLLNLESYYNHLSRVAEDPEFWAEGKGNLEEYRKSYG
jgi:hypothetical protein